MSKLKIALDIDGCVADFLEGFIKKANEMGYGADVPQSMDDITDYSVCKTQEKFNEIFHKFCNDDEFWLNLNPYHPVPKFEVQAYITIRPCTRVATAQWLKNVGAPEAPIFYAATPEEKLKHLHDSGSDILVEDNPKAFEYFKQNNALCALMDRPWNRKTEAGHLRIYSWADIISMVNTWDILRNYCDI